MLIQCLHYLRCRADGTVVTKSPWKLLIEQIVNEADAMDKRRAQLKIDQKKLNDAKQAMQTSLPMTDVIRLNVGGETIAVTLIIVKRKSRVSNQ